MNYYRESFNTFYKSIIDDFDLPFLLVLQQRGVVRIEAVEHYNRSTVSGYCNGNTIVGYSSINSAVRLYGNKVR